VKFRIDVQLPPGLFWRRLAVHQKIQQRRRFISHPPPGRAGRSKEAIEHSRKRWAVIYTQDCSFFRNAKFPLRYRHPQCLRQPSRCSRKCRPGDAWSGSSGPPPMARHPAHGPTAAGTPVGVDRQQTHTIVARQADRSGEGLKALFIYEVVPQLDFLPPSRPRGCARSWRMGPLRGSYLVITREFLRDRHQQIVDPLPSRLGSPARSHSHLSATLTQMITLR
jgi:hypothetical protein